MKLKQLLDQLRIKTYICFISFCEKEVLYNPNSDTDFLERLELASKEGYKLIPNQRIMENSYCITIKLSIKSIWKKIKKICS